jgi:hypothetical protein
MYCLYTVDTLLVRRIPPSAEVGGGESRVKESSPRRPPLEHVKNMTTGQQTSDSILPDNRQLQLFSPTLRCPKTSVVLIEKILYGFRLWR